MELGANSREVENISSKNDKEFDPESLQILQERVDKYSRTYRALLREYNVNNLFFHLYS